MRCPFCGSFDDQVIDSRPLDQSASIRRRRECSSCRRRFTTYERLEDLPLVVIKSDQRREPFDPQKVRRGIIVACKKRPVPTDTIDRIIGEIEYELQEYMTEVPSKIIGEKVLEKLKDIDLVAYIRFASVYKKFDSINKFIKELQKLKKTKKPLSKRKKK
ncbi:MAG: transcriptional regulator NrdR [Elusimicrobia bacterium]|nr:transcriptional regulator NrdR [Elusimicrobiota bacterium]